MADPTKAEVIVEANASQVISESAKAAERLAKVTKELRALENKFKDTFDPKHLEGSVRVLQSITTQLSRMSTQLEKVKGLNAKKLTAIGNGHDITTGGRLVTGETALRDTITRRRIKDIENTTEQMVARVTDATIKAHARGMKNSDQMVAASLRKQVADRDRFLRQNTQSALEASNRKHQQMLREMRVMYSPEQMAASGNLFRYRMGQRLLDADPTYLAARASRAQTSRLRTQNFYGDPEYTANLQHLNYMRDDFQKEQVKDLALQEARLNEKRRRVARERNELLDNELQEIRERKLDYSRRRLRTQYGDEGVLLGRERRDAYSDRWSRREGQVGVPQAQNERIYDRISSNGGADMMAIQGRVMMGYMALSGAIGIARNLSTFVVQLDKEFRQFQAISNTTSGEMVQMKKDLIEVSEQTKFTALEVAQAATILAQAGMSAANVREAIEAVTLLATASGSDLNVAVETVTSTLSIFNLEADQASNIANTFTAALNGSKLSIDRITLGLQYAGNTAAQFGVTYQELTALMGAMANSGIKSGSTLGTGMRMLMVSLTEPTKKFRAELASLGLTVDDVDVKAKGLVGVMQTLRDAGFGASEAYRSFEVRAASAYAAMSNNLDLAVKLEESFINSTAALKANETQMEALANQYARFQSAIGTAVYNAMTPFIDVLTIAVRKAADFATVLNQYPAILQTLSVALAGIGTAVGLRSLFALLRGGAIVLGLGAIRKGMQELGPAATRAGTAVNFLSVALRTMPFTLVASAAVAAATAIHAFGTKTTGLKEQIEGTEAIISRSRQQIDTLAQGISSIDQTIDNLRARQRELDDNPLQRQLRVREVVAQFSELGLEIDSTTASVQDLIEALNNIKNVNFGTQIEELNRLMSSNQLLLEQLRKQQADSVDAPEFLSLRSSVAARAQRMIGRSEESQKGFLKRANDPNMDAIDVTRWSISEGWKHIQRTGSGAFFEQDDVLRVLQLVLDPAKYQRDTATDWGNIYSRMTSRLGQLTNERDSLRLQQQSTPDDPNIAQQIKDAEEAVSYMEALLEAFGNRVQLIQQIQEANRQKEIYAMEKRNAQRDLIVENSNLRQMAPELAREMDDTLRGYRSYAEEDFVGANDRYAMVEELQNHLAEVATRWADAEADLIADMKAEGFTDEEIEAAVSQAKMDYTKYEVQAQDLINDQSEAAKKAYEAYYGARKTVLDRTMRQASSRLKSATSPEAVEQAQAVLRQTTEAMDELEREALDRRLRDTSLNDEARSIATAEYEQGREDRADQLRDFATQAVEQSRQIEAQIIQSRIKGLEAQEAEIQRQIDEATEEIKKAGAGVDLSGLLGSLNNLWSALRQATDYRYQLEDDLSRVAGDGSALAWLVHQESGGRWNPKENPNYAGRFQFGTARLRDYIGSTRGVSGADISPAEANAMKARFGADPELQQQVERWHFKDLENQITTKLGDQIGREVAGVVMDLPAMVGYSHLLGVGGLQNFMRTGIPGVDGNATSGLMYAKAMSGKSLDYDAFNATARTQGTARAAEALATKEAMDAANLAVSLKTIEVSQDASSQSIEAILSQARANFDPKLYNELKAELDRSDSLALEQFDLENENAPLARQQLVRQLAQQRAQRILEVYTQQVNAENEALDDALVAAEQKLAAMEASGKYSEGEIRAAETEVQNQQRLKNAAELAAIEGRIAFLKQEQVAAAKEYGENSLAALFWNEQISEVEKQRLALQQQINVTKAVEGGPGASDPFRDAMHSYQMGTGYFQMGANGMPEMLSQDKLTEQAWLDVLNTLHGGFETFFMEVSSGFKSLGDSVKGLGLGIVQMLQQAIAKALAFKAVMAVAQYVPGMSSVIPFLTPGGKMTGGMVPRRAAVGATGITGRDSIPYLLEPGEAVLRRSAVSVVGEDNLMALNNLGNRVQTPELAWPEPQSKDSGVVNVWVVSPDQQPPMTEKDIIAVISNDIATRGPVKNLIKSVQMGQI